MAISRHKVLSEMQQQLELASSKCGNLQKQLEIVKDKVRQSSTTNLVRMELPDNKENKTKTGELTEPADTNKETNCSSALSISSSSSEGNDERDVNIIKVFYDRLGQMDYPKSQVELSDISSVENDLDIDQLLSSVNFSINGGKKGKKEKKNGKKGKVDRTGNQKRKGKTVGKVASPYENASTLKPVVMKKNTKTKAAKASDSQSAGLASKSASRGQVKKVESEKTKKRKQICAHLPATKNNTKIFQEPIKRVMTLANQLRKTKSSTAAEKRESFTDTRSLTRIHPGNVPLVEEVRVEKVSPEKHQEVLGNQVNRNNEKPVPLMKIQKSPNRFVRNQILLPNRGNIKSQKTDRENHQDKGTSLSDFATVLEQTQPESEISQWNDTKANNANTGQKSIETASIVAMKRNDFSRRSFEVKVPTTTRERPPGRKPGSIRNASPAVKLEGIVTKIEAGDGPARPKNGITPYSAQDSKPGYSEVKKRVDLFEMVAGKEKIGDADRITDKGMPTSKFRGTSMTLRSNSSVCEDVSRRGVDSLRPPSSINSSSPTAMRANYNRKDPADIKAVTMSQIKKMKDNLLKFNTIPFIVGQSTSKSYHIGLNIQETYSLFKQTPSMTALMVKKYADPVHQSIHSRARSMKTGYTGRRSVSTTRGRESCPACDPIPERSPEQLADPWSVPQDEQNVVRVCTCLPKRMISFDQVLNQLYFSNMNLVKLHPNFLPKEGIVEESEAPDGKDKPAALPHRPTNTLYYTKLLRSIQNLKNNIAAV